MPHSSVLRSPSRVLVQPLRGQLAAIAAVDFALGDTVVAITGREVMVPTRYTLQVSATVHLDAEPQPGAIGGYPAWRFLNHGCDPNVVLRGRTFVARQPIRCGDELTFDYESTEWDMATPFVCECGSPACRGLIRGYRHLSPAARTAMTSEAAAHLRRAQTVAAP